MNEMFGYASSFNNGSASGDSSTMPWNTGSVTSMYSMFQNASAFNADISSWNTSYVTNMSSMFQSAPKFNQNLSTWNTSNVNEMSYMFNGASSFNNGAASGDSSVMPWNTSSVQEMSYMFQYTPAFNADIGSWNTSYVTNMRSMFQGASAFNQNISYNNVTGSWNTTNVTNMKQMFLNASVFNNGLAPGFSSTMQWNTSSVGNMSNMFYEASAFNADISGWDTHTVSNMSGMFQLAILFNKNLTTNGNIWNTSAVTDMNGMFTYATAFNGDISGWNTTNVKNMIYMFSNATSFDKDLGNWNITNVTNIEFMLDNTALSITNFDSLLNGWASRSVQLDRSLGATGLVYSEAGLPGYEILTSPPNNWSILGSTCFKEGTKILTKNGYIPVEDLKIGDLVLTYNHDYKKVVHIGTSKISHFNTDKRIIDKLYMYSKESHPELIEDLVITGWHSILVDEFKNEEEKDKTSKILGNPIPIVDNKYKLLSFVDENAEIYDQPGLYNIYHFSLESEDENQIFGIYANGLLVECCSTEYLLNQSKMKIIS